MSAESSEGRFARFIARADIVDVTNRYSDWTRSSEGLGIGLQLAMFAMQRIGGHMSRSTYRRAVRELAATVTIPLGDFLIIAKCHLELVRSGLAGIGHGRNRQAYNRDGVAQQATLLRSASLLVPRHPLIDSGWHRPSHFRNHCSYGLWGGSDR